MNQIEININVLSVFRKCEIHQFPIPCFELLHQYGYSVKKYSELSSKKLDACMALSKDATMIGHMIYYNDSMPNSRIRFSLMHELGHIILNSDNENYANHFASHLLAPRIAIHYSGCKNAADVMKRFDISEEASNYAFDDYRRWHREFSTRGESELDREMYLQFYNEAAEKFVWKIQKCDFCYSNNAYNGEIFCDSCKLFELRKKNTPAKVEDIREQELDFIRSKKLYGDL